MSDAWETMIFWFAFLIASGWALKRFYFSENVVLIERLRVFALVIEIATIGLFFFPWLPTSLGGFSGWELVTRGDDVGMVALGGLLFFSLVVFSTSKGSTLLKAGAA